MIIPFNGTATDVASDPNADLGSVTGGPVSILIENCSTDTTIYIVNGAGKTPADPRKRLLPGAVWGSDNVGVNDVFLVCASGQSADYDGIYERNG